MTGVLHFRALRPRLQQQRRSLTPEQRRAAELRAHSKLRAKALPQVASAVKRALMQAQRSVDQQLLLRAVEANLPSHVEAALTPALGVLQNELKRGFQDKLAPVFADAAANALKHLVKRKLQPQPQPRSAGGAGSGNFGHTGRPGEVGGSGEGGEGDERVYYHGTAEAALAAIRAEGIIPRGHIGFGGSAYVTTSRVLAEDYARNTAAAERDIGTPIVLEVRVPAEHVASLVASTRQPGREDVAFRFPEGMVIPPEWIVNARKLAAGDDGGKTVWMVLWAKEPEARSAGGAGSGNFGHEGRPGEVGGSGSGSALAATDKDFNANLFKEADAVSRSAEMGLTRDGALGLIRAGKDSDVDSYIMAQAVEQASSREAMMESFGSLQQWTTYGVGSAKLETAAAEGKASPEQLKAFEARASVAQAMFRRDFADKIDAKGNVTLWRGITGAQAKGLAKGEAELGVRTLSSWSMSQNDAHGFATSPGAAGGSSKYGALLRAEVNVKDLWSVPRMYGPQPAVRFSNDRHELVVRSTAGKVPVHVYWVKGGKK